MKKTRLIDILPEINKVLDQGDTFSFMPNGISMLPTIVGGRDTVTVKKPTDKLKKFDIILYRRKSGQFVLHRIIDLDSEKYILCGDNEVYPEKNVEHNQIIGVVTRYTRKGKIIEADSKKFISDAKKRVNSRPYRQFVFRAKNKLKRIFKIK